MLGTGDLLSAMRAKTHFETGGRPDWLGFLEGSHSGCCGEGTRSEQEGGREAREKAVVLEVTESSTGKATFAQRSE